MSRIGAAVAGILAEPSYARRAQHVATEIASLPDESALVAEIERLGSTSPV